MSELIHQQLILCILNTRKKYFAQHWLPSTNASVVTLSVSSVCVRACFDALTFESIDLDSLFWYTGTSNIKRYKSSS